MGFRFRKSVSLGKGARLNFSKKSVGLSFGGKGARISLNSSGRITKSVGIPGTGMSYVSSSNIFSKPQKAEFSEPGIEPDIYSDNMEQDNIEPENGDMFAPAPKKPKKKMPGTLKIVLWIAAIILGLGLFPFMWIIAPVPAVIYFIKSQNVKKSRNVAITAAVCILSLVMFIKLPKNNDLPVVAGTTENTKVTSAATTAAENTITETVTTTTQATTTETAVTTTQAATTTENAKSTTADVTTTSITTTQAEQSSGPKEISVLGGTTVKAGETATLTIQGEPKTQYRIEVYYKSGLSKAEGLEAKTSDADGKVSWSWKVGAKTAPGTYKIIITSDKGKKEIPFTVT